MGDRQMLPMQTKITAEVGHEQRWWQGGTRRQGSHGFGVDRRVSQLKSKNSRLICLRNDCMVTIILSFLLPVGLP